MTLLTELRAIAVNYLAETDSGMTLPNLNSLGNKIIPDDDPEKIQNFWNWFGESKMTYIGGRPKVFYHGTASRLRGEDQPTFNAFDKSKLGARSHFSSKVGFFFTESSQMAHEFGDRVMAVYLRMINPKYYRRGNYDDRLEYEFYRTHKDKDVYEASRPLKALQAHKDSYDCFVADIYHRNGEIPYWDNQQGNFNDTYDLGEQRTAFVDNYVNSLKSEGYDGIIIEATVADASRNFGNKTTQYCVFDPEQIKSVENVGSFSSTNPNIYESL